MACNECDQQKKMNRFQKIVWIFSFYILFASVYGTIQLVKDLITFFK